MKHLFVVIFMGAGLVYGGDYRLVEVRIQTIEVGRIPLSIEMSKEIKSAEIEGKILLRNSYPLNLSFSSVEAAQDYAKTEYCRSSHTPSGDGIFELGNGALKIPLKNVKTDHVDSVSFYVRNADGTGPFGYAVSCKE